jgi:hypothetical protein
MNNTIVIKGKGMITYLTFTALCRYYPEASLLEPKIKWWQVDSRYELRFQNLPIFDIIAIQQFVESHQRSSANMRMEVF